MVKWDKSQSLILNRILYHEIKKYCSFLYQILQPELTQESHYLIVLSVQCVHLHYGLYDFNFDIWGKFPGTNLFKNIVISFSSLRKWPLHATLLLFFLWRNLISRRSSITTPKRHSAKKTTKISNKHKENRLLSYQPPKQKN